MVDVDHFKMLNDRQGHLAGDRCLRQIAQALSASVSREADMVARYGGEEFAVLLPATEDEGASLIARQMIAAVLACHIPNHTPIGDCVTVSVGIASFSPQGARTADALIDAADRALYQAKQGGRNCLRWAEEGSAACVPLSSL
jgi:diguanylate cyclase (GGDEF)-like protein